MTNTEENKSDKEQNKQEAKKQNIGVEAAFLRGIASRREDPTADPHDVLGEIVKQSRETFLSNEQVVSLGLLYALTQSAEKAEAAQLDPNVENLQKYAEETTALTDKITQLAA